MLQKLEIMQQIKLKKCIPIRFTRKGYYTILKIDYRKGIVKIKNSEPGFVAWEEDLEYWVPIKELLQHAEETQ